MSDRIKLVRDSTVVRVSAADVDRFKALGYSEPKPVRKAPVRKRKPKAGDA